MNGPLFLFRPEPGWTETANRARAIGFEVAGQPLAEVVAVEWTAPDARHFDGLLVGSRNVFRMGGNQLAGLKLLPVYAVGTATADAARTAGFEVAQCGQGGLQSLLDSLPGPGLRLLQLRGEASVPLHPPLNISVTERVVYRLAPRRLTAETVSQLAHGGVVALHSGETAAQFDADCSSLGIERGRLQLVVLAPRIADRAGTGWGAIHIAETPQDERVLAMARGLCQTDARGTG